MIDSPPKPTSQASSQKTSLKIETKWEPYAVGFSQQTDRSNRIAVGSFLSREENYVHIFGLDLDKGSVSKPLTFHHRFLPTKIKWRPPGQTSYLDLLATTSNTLAIWQVKGNQSVIQVADMQLPVPEAKVSVPLTSMDWSSQDLQMVVTSSIDMSLVCWDIERQQAVKRISAHEQEILDVAFSPAERQTIATVSSDGSCRVFDMRQSHTTDVIIERQGTLARLAWSQSNEHQIAVLPLEGDTVTVLDRRSGANNNTVLIKHHSPDTTSLAWQPNHRNHLATGSADGLLRLWKVPTTAFELNKPYTTFQLDAAISNVAWSSLGAGWLSVTKPTGVELLQVGC